MLAAWSGPAVIAGFMIPWIFFIGWFQPPSPSLGAAEIATVFQQNTFGIRFGMMMLTYAGAMNTFFGGIIMIYMLRMKGPSPLYAYTQFGSAVVSSVIFIVCALMWEGVAFRPERPADITQFGNDMTWLLFDMSTSPPFIQWIALGLAVLMDKSSPPVFPRWFGYYNFWSALLFIPSSLITFFKTGPFSWAGIFGWYFVLTDFCVWYIVTFVMLVKAIKQHRQSAFA